MAITTCITNQFKLDILKGGHQFGGTATGTFKWALYVTATMGATTNAYTATAEITGTGYTATGVGTAPTLSASGTTTYVDFVDPQWTASSFTADGTLLYCSSIANGATTNGSIGLWDFSGPKTVSSGTFTIVLPTADTTNAILRYTS